MELTKMREVINHVKEITDLKIEIDTSNALTDLKKFLTKEKVIIDTKKIDTEEYLQYNDEIKSKLLLYFYLSDTNLSKTKLKKSFGLKVNKVESILTDFTFSQEAACPCCEKTIVVKLKNAKSPVLSNTVICSKCKHKIDSDKIYSDCECEKCQKLINSTHSFFKDLKINIDKDIESIIEGVKQTCKNHNNSNTEKRLAWYANKYSSDLNKTEREIISFAPSSYDELQSFIGSKKFRDLEQSLIEKKIIYKEYITYDISQILDSILTSLDIPLLINFSRKEGYGLRSESVKFSEVDFSNIKIESIYVKRNLNSEHLFINLNNMDLSNIKQYEGEIYSYIEICPFIFQIVNFKSLVSEQKCYYIIDRLNPYYFNKEDISDYAIIDKNKVIPAFKSDVEKNQYQFLIQKYSDYIVIPNIPLKNFINIEFIRANFENMECKYLEYCIIDFVIFTTEGFPIKAIELQRGKHHDDQEYIEKDKLKKKAIKLTGLIYQELY